MKLLVGHEELWIVVPDGQSYDACEVDLPAPVVKRIRKAEKEWDDCLEIIRKAHAKKWGAIQAQEEAARRKRIERMKKAGTYVPPDFTD